MSGVDYLWQNKNSLSLFHDWFHDWGVTVHEWSHNWSVTRPCNRKTVTPMKSRAQQKDASFQFPEDRQKKKMKSQYKESLRFFILSLTNKVILEVRWIYFESRFVTWSTVWKSFCNNKKKATIKMSLMSSCWYLICPVCKHWKKWWDVQVIRSWIYSTILTHSCDYLISSSCRYRSRAYGLTFTSNVWEINMIPMTLTVFQELLVSTVVFQTTVSAEPQSAESDWFELTERPW